MKLVVATTSAHKLGEIGALLADFPQLQVLSLRDFPSVEEPDENGSTMAENARIKAVYYAQHTQLPTLADDSGIEVDALNGAPGIHSARWIEGSDADRTNALLKRLQNVPDTQRSSRYRCALCLMDRDGKLVLETEATCEGRIGYEWRGSNGFGYDPVFEITQATGAPEWMGRTLAEAPTEVKAQISHRARAVRQLAELMRNKVL